MVVFIDFNIKQMDNINILFIKQMDNRYSMDNIIHIIQLILQLINNGFYF